MSKLMTFCLLALLGMLQYKLWFAPDATRQTYAIQQTIKKQAVKLASLNKENEMLALEIYNLKYKDEEIEEKARTQLGMIKKGETFYQVID